MRTKEQWMSEFKSLVEENLSNPYFKNSDLAEKMEMSDRQFYRCVEDFFEETPNNYIRRIRLEKASEMAHSGEYNTVKEISLRVGFRKVSYFSKLFEEKEGIAPSAILRKFY
jgi:AraC-like DNA-binding protein